VESQPGEVMDPAIATIIVAAIGLITAIVVEQIRTRSHMRKVHAENRSDHAFVAGKLDSLGNKIDNVALDLRDVKADVRDLKQDHRQLAQKHRELADKVDAQEAEL